MLEELRPVIKIKSGNRKALRAAASNYLKHFGNTSYRAEYFGMLNNSGCDREKKKFYMENRKM